MRPAAKQFWQAIMRNMAKRAASRFISRRASSMIRGRATKFENRLGEEISDLLEEGVGLMELADLVQQFDQIIDNARDAASNAAQGVFLEAYKSCNPGQQSLIDAYCSDSAYDYFQEAERPDPNEYFDFQASQHEAIEQALSGTIEQSYAAGSAAGIDVIYSGVAGFVGELIADAAVDIMGQGRKGRGGWADPEYNARNSMRNYGDYDSLVPQSVRNSPMWRPIEDPKFFILPDHPDAPYWLKESSKSTYGLVSGQWSLDQAQTFRKNLYAATASNPNSPNPPMNYDPYEGGVPKLDYDTPYPSGNYWTRYN